MDTPMQLPFVLASRFVAAPDLEGTLPIVKDLNRKGLHIALDLLGEHIHDRNRAAAARDTYMELVRTIADERGRNHLDQHVRISIKLSMMGQLIDEDFCQDNLKRLLGVAKEHDVYVRLDMESSKLTESTLNHFEKAYEEFPDHVGPVLQAMLKRTAEDVARICELNASVRLCKGAYNEPRELAFRKTDEIRQRFIMYAKQLISEARYPGIATHDDEIIRATKTYVASKGIDKSQFEFQMLYGLRSETQLDLKREGYDVLVYVPYGTEWLPYFYRRLRERKENVWFVLKNLFRQ